jgi:hypothetical protein
LDKNAATSAFQNAIETHVPAFETFFLAKLFGARISYAAESCIVEISYQGALIRNHRPSRAGRWT